MWMGIPGGAVQLCKIRIISGWVLIKALEIELEYLLARNILSFCRLFNDTNSSQIQVIFRLVILSKILVVRFNAFSAVSVTFPLWAPRAEMVIARIEDKQVKVGDILERPAGSRQCLARVPFGDAVAIQELLGIPTAVFLVYTDAHLRHCFVRWDHQTRRSTFGRVVEMPVVAVVLKVVRVVHDDAHRTQRDFWFSDYYLAKSLIEAGYLQKEGCISI